MSGRDIPQAQPREVQEITRGRASTSFTGLHNNNNNPNFNSTNSTHSSSSAESSPRKVSSSWTESHVPPAFPTTPSPLTPTDVDVFTCKQCIRPVHIHDSILNSLSFFKSPDTSSSTSTSPSSPAPLPSSTPGAPSVPTPLPPMSLMLTLEAPFPPPNPQAVVLDPTIAAAVEAAEGRGFLEQGESFSDRLERAGRVFEVASLQTGFEHPMCRECAEGVVARLGSEIASAEATRDAYAAHLRSVLAESGGVDGNALREAEYADQLAALEAEEAELEAELAAVLAEGDAVAAEGKEVERDVKVLDALEDAYWREYNAFHETVLGFEDRRVRIENDSEVAYATLKELQMTNVYNDTFHIWFEGQFGTINSFRLGRLPSVQVSWNEINAAWGQAALLLWTLASKTSFSFSAYTIRPLGSFTKVYRNDKASHSGFELYGSASGFSKRLLGNRSFDKAMVAFLACLRELGEHIESIDPNFRVPYQIVDAKIDGVGIRIASFSGFESWTRACKKMLTNLKWILAWVSKKRV